MEPLHAAAKCLMDVIQGLDQAVTLSQPLEQHRCTTCLQKTDRPLKSSVCRRPHSGGGRLPEERVLRLQSTSRLTLGDKERHHWPN